MKMTKWEYITMISKHGAAYGGNGGVLDLLLWCNKLNTASVTHEEAEKFWTMLSEQKKGKANIK